MIFQGEARMWGEYDCNTPATTVDLFLRKVNEIEPDFIIYSGERKDESVISALQRKTAVTGNVLCKQLQLSLFAGQIWTYFDILDMLNVVASTDKHDKGTNKRWPNQWQISCAWKGNLFIKWYVFAYPTSQTLAFNNPTYHVWFYICAKVVCVIM